MKLDSDSKKIIRLLNSAGFKAYAVGGCVRDSIIKKPISDIDLTTSALPNQVEKILFANGIKVIETGIKHGTVTAVLNSKHIEITTFRSDGNYSDSRHPDSVRFVSDIKEDLSRRDFTINAIAYNDEEGYIDPFGGADDIKKSMIRAVGDPKKRFEEDALRILRALRFASTLGFAIEKNTENAIHNCAGSLNNIAPERIFSELMGILSGKGGDVYRILHQYRDVVGVIIPEIKPCFDCAQNNTWHIYDVYEHIIHAVMYSKNEPVIRLTMLLHDIGKPAVKYSDENGKDHFKKHAPIGAEIADKVLDRFNISKKLHEEVVLLVKYHQSVEDVEHIKLKRWLSEIGESYTRDLLNVRMADLKAHNPARTEAEEIQLSYLIENLDEVIKSQQAYKLSDLKINGKDLLSLGFEGEIIGLILNEILSLVIDDKIQNERELELDYIKSHFSS